MGIVVLPLMALIFIAWISLTLLIASRIQRLMQKWLPTGKHISLLVYPVCILVAWLIPNLSGLLEQRNMDKVAAQCGWHYNKQIENVDGVFLEMKDPMIDTFTSIYGAVEYTHANRIVHLENHIRNSLTERTFRYGVKKTISQVANNIYREEILFIDFETQELLGKRVEYNFYKRSSTSSLLNIALYHLSFQPKGCGFTNPGQTDIQSEAIKILSPRVSKIHGFSPRRVQ